MPRQLSPAHTALDFVLAPEDEGRLFRHMRDDILGKIQPRFGEEAGSGHAVAGEVGSGTLVADDAAIVPQRRPEAARVRDGGRVQLPATELVHNSTLRIAAYRLALGKGI